MCSIDFFIGMCARRIHEGKPFLAYHHTHGFALMLTDTMDAVANADEEDTEPKKPGKVKKGSISGMRREIKRMRKERRIFDLSVVEFDGCALTTEGSPELSALSEMVS